MMYKSFISLIYKFLYACVYDTNLYWGLLLKMVSTFSPLLPWDSERRNYSKYSYVLSSNFMNRKAVTC